MFKKIMLLGAAIAATVAFAAPAAQAQWTHGANPLAGNATINLQGQTKFETLSGLFEGLLTAQLELTGGTTTAHVRNVTVDNCKTLGGLSSFFCTATPAGPWIAHTISGTKTVRITNISLTNHYYADPGHAVYIGLSTTLTGNVLAEVNNAAAISSVTSLTGEGTEAAGWSVVVSGSLTATTNKGTYGFK